MPMERVVLNIGGNVRRAKLHGRDHIVAPVTLIQPGVLYGSQGPLFYPPTEVVKNYKAWDHVPLVVYHPKANGGHISARSPKILEKQGVGLLLQTRVHNGALKAEGWFDVEKVKRVDNRVLTALESGQRMEISTGLYTNNIPAQNGAQYNGRPYSFVAINYRPDHLAILPDQKGACSLDDGCGLNVNYSAGQSRDNQGRFGSGGGGGGSAKLAPDTGGGTGGGGSSSASQAERTFKKIMSQPHPPQNVGQAEQQGANEYFNSGALQEEFKNHKIAGKAVGTEFAKAKVVDALKGGKPKGLIELGKATGLKPGTGQDPMKSQLNQALVKLRDSGKIKASDPRFGEPSFTINYSQGQPRDNQGRFGGGGGSGGGSSRPTKGHMKELSHRDLENLTPADYRKVEGWDGSLEDDASYGGAVFDDSGKILLREPADHFDDYHWTFPKGRADGPDDSPLRAAVREVGEETGHLGQVTGLVPGSFEGGTSKMNLFVMQSKDRDVSKMDAETQSVKWATYGEAKKLISKTENPIGKARDLKALDAAFKAREEILSSNRVNKSLGLAANAAAKWITVRGTPVKIGAGGAIVGGPAALVQLSKDRATTKKSKERLPTARKLSAKESAKNLPLAKEIPKSKGPPPLPKSTSKLKDLKKPNESKTPVAKIPGGQKAGEARKAKALQEVDAAKKRIATAKKQGAMMPGVNLPKNPKKVNQGQAKEFLASKGMKMGKGKTDLKTGKTSYWMSGGKAGGGTWMSASKIKSLIYKAAGTGGKS